MDFGCACGPALGGLFLPRAGAGAALACLLDRSTAVLPAAVRLTSGQEFGLVIRRGRRTARPRLVVHALIGASGFAQPTRTRVGFVVSKAVGNSVIRHRVTRRLRHLLRDRLDVLPTATLLVVRALPAAATATSGELGIDVDSALRRLGFASRDRQAGSVKALS